MRSPLPPVPSRWSPLRLSRTIGLLSVLGGCSLVSLIADEEQANERKQQQMREEQAAQQRRQEQLAARHREVAAELVRLRAELGAGRDPVRNALLFAKVVADRHELPPAPTPPESASLLHESIAYVMKAMDVALTLEEHAALLALPRTPAVDNAVVSTCPRFRAMIQQSDLETFLDLCFARAGNEVKRVTWPGIERDLATYQRIKAQRRAEEERAQREEEERQRKAAEAAAAEAARGLREGTCYSDSECGGGACRNNRCTTAGGTCYSDSECPRGSCRNNRCTTAGGTCYSDSECGGGVCRSNQCTTAGGTCYSDSECGGGVCRSNRCTTAGGTCYSDSECAGGVCRSNRCTTAGGTCYSDSECPGGTCRSNRCS